MSQWVDLVPNKSATAYQYCKKHAAIASSGLLVSRITLSFRGDPSNDLEEGCVGCGTRLRMGGRSLGVAELRSVIVSGETYLLLISMGW